MMWSSSRIARLAASGALLVFAFAASSWGEGFGTPVMDGNLAGDEAVYNAAEASDGVDPPQGNAPMDLGDLYVCNDDGYWYFHFSVHDDLAVNQWGKYLLFIDTTNDTNGGTTDPWTRNIVVSDPHKAEFSVRSWIDGGGLYGPGKTQLWAWDQGLGTWSNSGLIAGAALFTGTTLSGFEWKVARAALGDPSTIWCEVASTGNTTTDNAQDTINDPANDWNATDWTTTAVISNSTMVARSTGVDTTKPTVVGGCTSDPGDGFSDTVTITFSEPVDQTTAETASNYTDLGGRTVFSPTLVAPDQVEVIVSPVYTFGTCQQIRVANVKDLSDNVIDDNGTTNVADFYAFRLIVRGHMDLHMQADDTPPHTFALEGSQWPLTWDPLCDFLMEDADADSIYRGDVSFCLPCAQAALRGTAAPVVQEVQYKFTHQCSEWESFGDNHYYTIDPVTLEAGTDSVDIYWNNEAPVDFTTVDVDVIFTVRSFVSNPPFASGDSLGLGGSVLPLDWNNPPTNFMRDDGTAPDQTASDGVYSSRVTFPAGSLKSVNYKYLLRAVADTAFAFECSGQGDRNVFLDDTIFSTSNPITLDLAHFDDCAFSTGAPALAITPVGYSLDPGRPNPTSTISSISYALPRPTAVRLDVYDVSGRLVRTLVDETRPEGRHTVVWNGRRADGTPLPSGVYFMRLSAGDFQQSRKIVLMR